MMMLSQIIHIDNPKTTVLIRLIVGANFLLKGIQKFQFPATCGVGRFDKIGLPTPEISGNFVGTFR
ncbi:hypothetical protein AU378_18050 [Chryseobacterium kwangjuense]|uniref:Uncharacterized protein n=1 Tax=Chryseobacterium kwangjuense TaxID=267125 RepID=A0A135W9H7_9FLAO|nr:hypothetical protein AU378_18050 [Chryseobacterium kwangjuense]